MLRYLKSWTLQLRWQRLPAFEKLAHLLVDHLEGILNYCRVKVRFSVAEAINGNFKTLLRSGRGYKNLRYLLLKAQRMAATKTEFLASDSCSEPNNLALEFPGPLQRRRGRGSRGADGLLLHCAVRTLPAVRLRALLWIAFSG